MSATDAFIRFSQPLDAFADRCRAKHVYNYPYTLVGTALGTKVRIREKPGVFTPYFGLDYLGIGQHPDLIDAYRESISEYGTGKACSRTVTESEAHQGLEGDLADFKRAESCVLANTGYGANVMLLSLLFGPMDALGARFTEKRKIEVFVDRLSHKSLLDTLTTLQARKSGTIELEVRKYDHLDYVALEELMEKTKNDDVFRFIVGDSLYSMNGDFADVEKLLLLAKKYDAFLVLDNAHSDGVYGPEGRGCVEAAGITDPEDLRRIFQTGTLSKAFAGIGGHATMFPSLAELARVSHNPYIFSVALPSFQVAAKRKGLRLVRGPIGDARRKRLVESSETLRNEFRTAGFNILGSQSHIIPALPSIAEVFCPSSSFGTSGVSFWIDPS